MKRVVFVVAALVGSFAFAQEIGTEITPVGPTSSANQQNTNTTASDPNANTPPPQKKQARLGETPKFDGTKVSASAGDFGVRAGFGASGSTGIPTGAGAAATGVAAPTVGISYFATDSFKLLFDLGFGMGIVGSGVFFALGANLGFDLMFRNPGDALRPFFHFAANFNLAGSNAVNVGFGAQTGFGAEYFFSPSFSINGRLMLAVPMVIFGSGLAIGIFTVTPGVGATWYF